MGFFDESKPADGFSSHPSGDFIGVLYRNERFNKKGNSIAFVIGYKNTDGQAPKGSNIDEFFTILNDKGQLASTEQRGFLMARLLGAFGISEDTQRQALANANSPGEIVNTLVRLVQPYVGRKVQYSIRTNKAGYQNVRGGPQGVVPVLLTTDVDGDPWATPNTVQGQPAMAGAPSSAADVLNGLDIDGLDI